jgi:hypothetical protein
VAASLVPLADQAHECPRHILVDLCQLLAAKHEDGKSLFDNYGGMFFTLPYQELDLIVFCTALLVFLIDFARPQLHMHLASDDEPFLFDLDEKEKERGIDSSKIWKSGTSKK